MATDDQTSEDEMRQSTYRPIPAPRPNVNARLRANIEAEPAPAPAKKGPPRDADEAERRFWGRYGLAVLSLLVGPVKRPTTIEGWYDLADQLRDVLDAPTATQVATILEHLAGELRGLPTNE